MNKSDRDHMLDLVADYFVRELSQKELGQLQQFLKNDAEARQLFADAGRDEWLLHHVHHMEAGRIVYLNPRRSRSHRIRAIAAAVAIIATLGTVFYAQKATISQMIASQKPKAPVIARVSDCFAPEGAAISVVNDGHVRKLNSSSGIREGDRVIIPPGCQLAFQYLEEETEIRLDGGSLVHVTDVDGAKHIRLNEGRLFADVDKQPKGSPMRVATRDAEVVVLGTSFEVFAGEITRLSVTSGKVRFNSINSGHSIVVSSGSFAEAQESMVSNPYRQLRLTPVEDLSLNQTGDDTLIAVDPVRNYRGLLKFDLGRIPGKIVEAKLRMRVMRNKQDVGGAGDLRLFRVAPAMGGEGPREQIAHFSGGAGRGKDLVLDVDISQLSNGLNAFLMTLDRGGNDFWFSSSRGAFSPVLELKVAEE